ncbi:hypothetical protein C8A03DRAFT_48127 [Achaetomium macrosporum]|uniref:Uncharacterized protein n=1 Tax=Achaetomium macrosporum TaxID=79813 RepID=A0AAN7C1A4_9PEZI|nr:hypothetical protein C8A03DRAFT_48127 [Achaetomium macrosporum]
MAVSLDSQIFYNPIVATSPEPASRGPLLRKAKPSAASFGAPLHPPPPLQDAHDPQRGSAGKSQHNAILIPSDGDSDDDLDDGRSDTSFPPLEELLAAAYNKFKSGSVVSKSIDAAPDESDAPEPSVTSGPGPDDKFANQQQRRSSLGPSLEPLPSSAKSVHATQTQAVPAGYAAFEPGQASAPDNTSRDTTVPETDAASLAEHGATHHDHGMQHGPRPSEKPCGTTSNHDGSICLDNEFWDRRFPFSHQALQRRLQARHAAKSAYNAAEADQSQSILDPHCRPLGPRRAASSHGGSAAASLECKTQQRSDSCCLSQHYHHRGDSVRTNDPEYRHPQVLYYGGEQDEESSVVPPQAQESRAGIPTIRQPEPGQYSAHRLSSPIAGSNAKQGKDEDIVQPPRGKGRRVNTSAPTTRRTAPKRQTPQRPPPTQGQNRRQSQRSISKPQSSAGSALEEETVEAAFASFEEWPLEAVLERMEFTLNPCTNRGRGDRAPENPRRKSPVGTISSMGRAFPSRITPTAEEVQGDEYFEVEDIRGWR